MLLIMATGNYNFFNVLYGALCLSLADDRWWRGTEKPQEGRRILRFLELAFNTSAVAAVCYLTAVYCFDWDTLEPKLMFTQSSFNQFVAQCRDPIQKNLENTSASVMAPKMVRDFSLILLLV